MWKANCPTKIKHFIYRTANNIIPCQANLVRRGIEAAEFCWMCGQEVWETQEHLFMQCAWARAAWFQHPLGIRIDQVNLTFTEWLKEVCLNQSIDIAALIFQGVWAIWKARNDKLFNELSPDPISAINSNMNSLQDWREAQNSLNVEENTNPEVAWKALAGGKIKINIDAGWTGSNSTGFGFIARSHTGSLLVAGTHLECQRLDPLVAEASALRWSMMKACELEMDSVTFESDSLIVIRAMRADSSDWTIHNIIQDCQALAENFNSVSFSHVKRNANLPAHVLASVAIKYQDQLWWDYPPTEIEHPLFVDAAFS
ncbi:uncharacterized protein LOC130727579 [Lotus japonicus]|uniref:uncharacterized protein LOC130727579 n=1 Tax=Lotus japonicus TaxID=34305 RepID=UPI0025900C63|nr:uncharacterized protein LOC130727579 [Lotus japonicus]